MNQSEILGKLIDFLTLLKKEIDVVSPAEPLPTSSDFFTQAINYVLPNEGGYVNNPAHHDHGGPTNMGITQATLLRWRLKTNPNAVVTADEVKNLTLDEAKAIYKQFYWLDYNFDRILNEPVAIALFDQGCLDGQVTAIKLAQNACNDCGQTLLVDGVVGPDTIKGFDRVKPSDFLKAFKARIVARLDLIVKNNSSQQVFYNGWVSRANRLLTLA